MSSKRTNKKPRLDFGGCNPTNIDPEGDLVLHVGQDEKLSLRIRVSKKILTLASPVFKAMLGPGFSERDATVLPLPEDDPTAMHNLCKILHHQANDLNFREGAWLSDMALAAHKYQCGDKCQFVVRSMMCECLEHPSQSIHSDGFMVPIKLRLEHAIAVAYLCDDVELFWKLTAAGIDYTTTLEVGRGTVSKKLFAIVPTEIIHHMMQAKAAQMNELILISYEPLEAFNTDLFVEGTDCNLAEQQLLRYVRGLGRYKIAIHDSREQPLPNGAEAFSSLAEDLSTPPRNSKVCYSTTDCDLCGYDWNEALTKCAIAAEATRGKGMCLLCVKAGDFKPVQDCDNHQIWA